MESIGLTGSFVHLVSLWEQHNITECLDLMLLYEAITQLFLRSVLDECNAVVLQTTSHR